MTAPGFERSRPAAGPVVQGFRDGGFSVDGIVHRALLLTPERALAWDPPALDALGLENLAPVLDMAPPPEFLILGTGAAMAIAPRGLVRALDARGIGVEAMDSRAAARTWGLLRAEERRIAAAILPLLGSFARAAVERLGSIHCRTQRSKEAKDLTPRPVIPALRRRLRRRSGWTSAKPKAGIQTGFRLDPGLRRDDEQERVTPFASLLLCVKICGAVAEGDAGRSLGTRWDPPPAANAPRAPRRCGPS